MGKRVEDFKAAKQIKAVIILKGAELVGKIQAHFGSGYTGITCHVDLWDFSKEEGRLQQGRTHGGGYDLFTSAIDGMTIDGVVIYNHSVTSDTTKLWLAEYQKAKTPTEKEELVRDAEKGGFSFNNWRATEGGYTSCYYIGGLERLRAMGYEVIEAI